MLDEPFRSDLRAFQNASFLFQTWRNDGINTCSIKMIAQRFLPRYESYKLFIGQYLYVIYLHLAVSEWSI